MPEEKQDSEGNWPGEQESDDESPDKISQENGRGQGISEERGKAQEIAGRGRDAGGGCGFVNEFGGTGAVRIPAGGGDDAEHKGGE